MFSDAQGDADDRDDLHDDDGDQGGVVLHGLQSVIGHGPDGEVVRLEGDGLGGGIVGAVDLFEFAVFMQVVDLDISRGLSCGKLVREYDRDVSIECRYGGCSGGGRQTVDTRISDPGLLIFIKNRGVRIGDRQGDIGPCGGQCLGGIIAEFEDSRFQFEFRG